MKDRSMKRVWSAFLAAVLTAAILPFTGFAARAEEDGWWTRLSGSNRYSTMAAIAEEAYPAAANGTLETLIVATGESFPDALSGAALAGVYRCPIITTKTASLRKEARTEIERLASKDGCKVLILGGPTAVSDKVVEEIKAIGKYISVERVAGASRSKTAIKVFNKGFADASGKSKSDTVIITTGFNFADALAISPYSYASRTPIFLTQKDGSLGADVKAVLEKAGFRKAIIVGGTLAVTKATEKALGGMGMTVLRLADSTRYKTGVQIIRWELGELENAAFQPSVRMSLDGMGIARGDDFPDALAAASLLGKTKSVLLLVHNTDKPSADRPAVKEVLGDAAELLDQGFIFGGTGAVSPETEAMLNDVIPAEEEFPVEAEAEAKDLAEAAASLRASLVNHAERITLRFPGTSFEQNDWEALWEKTLEHTGNPKEGDYLRSEVIGAIWGSTVENGTVTLGVTAYHKNTADEVRAEDKAVKKFFSTYPVKSLKTDYEKVRAIYDYLCDSVVYDYERKQEEIIYFDRWGEEDLLIAHSAYAALVENRAVCEGYAAAFYRLALEAGLDARIVTGDAGERHAWNLVRVDGKYYYLDATWDAGNGEYYYFLYPDFSDHTPDVDFSEIYTVSEKAYNKPDQQVFKEGDYEFTKSYGARLVKYTGQEESIFVPDSLGGLPVVSAGNNTFEEGIIKKLTFPEGFRHLYDAINTYTLEEITLPSTLVWNLSGICPIVASEVKKVSVDPRNPLLRVVDGIIYNWNMDIALYCPAKLNVQTIRIPEGVKTIGNSAFRYLGIAKKVVLPSTLTGITCFAFVDAHSLEEINIPENCVDIGQWALGDTGLKELHLPAAIQVLDGAFVANCPNLKVITLEEGCERYFVRDGVLYCRDNEEELRLMAYPAAMEGTVFTVPDDVKYIWSYAFSYNRLEKITLPDTLAGIQNAAFYHSSKLKEISIPKSVTYIYDQGFYYCENLKKITVLSDTVELTDLAFGRADFGPDYPVIVAHKGSTAEAYAADYSLKFQELK